MKHQNREIYRVTKEVGLIGMTLIYTGIILFTNFLFFIFIAVYMSRMNYGAEVLIFVLTLYTYIINKLESKVIIKGNKKYLIVSYIWLLTISTISIYLKQFFYEMKDIFDVYFIFVFVIFFLVPIVQFLGLFEHLIKKENK